MTLADLLKETLDVASQDVWENERTLTRVRVFGMQPHSMGLSLREVVAVLELLGVERSHGAIWDWNHTLAEAQSDPPTAEPSRVAVDETRIEVEGEEKWLYAVIDTGSKLLLEIDVFSRRGTDPAAAFLHRFGEKHDVSETEFLVDAAGYLTALFRRGLSGQLEYRERNTSRNVFRRSRCGSTAFMRSGGAVRRALAAGSSGSDTTTTTIDRIRRSEVGRQLRRCSSIQYRNPNCHPLVMETNNVPLGCESAFP